MASKQPSHTTQTTEVKLPAWVDAASQKNYALAERIAAKPYQEYTGQTVAGVSDTTQQAYDMFKNTLGTGDTQRNQASDLFTKAGQGIIGMDRNAYMNPYVQNVVDTSMAELEKSRQQSLMTNSDSAIAAKAFGGSRHGVVDAVTNSETASKAGLLSSQLYKDAYDNASGLMQGDINNMLSAGSGLLTTGESLAEQRGKDFSGLLGIGQAEQAQTQKELDDAYSRWQDRQNEDVNDLNLLLSALGMSPYGKTETANKTTSGGGGTDIAQAGLGVFSLLMGLFSDREDKTDIEKLGVDPATGLQMYAYRYKKDPKHYPKVVGPMAQDIEKKFPGSTKKVGGHMMVPGVLTNG